MPEPGQRIGSYELIRELGRGGMGTVFLARDIKLGRKVAIKFLHSASPEVAARFILEARTTARCNHENIVVIHEVGEHDGDPFMVLEYLQGTSLRALMMMSEGRAISPGRAVELMLPVVRALERAHEHNIVHRDLKPDNIFLTESGTVKVLDFGIAKLLQGDARSALAGRASVPPPVPGQAVITPSLPPGLPPGVPPDLTGMPDDPDLPGAGAGAGAPATRQGALVGTLPYMSPEQWGVDTVDHRTDLWAVGIILFQLVAGKHPLAPRAGWELMITSVLDEPMPGVRQACPDVPDELCAIIDRCLVKPKNQRMGSARELADALAPLLPGRHTRSLRTDQSPYTGLNAFQEADASRFFGRGREIATAVTRLHSQPLLAVTGPSGAGKSSFVRAGVIPALKQSGEPWTSLVVRPGREPVMALAQLILPLVGTSSTTSSPTTVAGDLAELHAIAQRLYHEPGYLGAALRSRARQSGRKMVVFVDQLEELYTLVPDPAERLAFTHCLGSVADDATAPLRVILSMRSDFLDRAAEDPRFLSELSQGLMFLAAPSRDGLREALVEPAQMAGYTFENPAMVEDMLDHLEETPGGLPLLQFAASKLWELRDTSTRLLTAASYEHIGRIAGALASHADAVLYELPPPLQGLAHGLLLRLVTPERTRALVPLAELDQLSPRPGEMVRLVEHLAQARLLVVQTPDARGGPENRGAGAGAAGQTSVELVHESLIHTWPMLRRWLEEGQEDAVFLQELRNAARQWHARGCPAGLCWRGEQASEAERFVRRYRGELTAVEQAFLHAVHALAARAVRRRRIAIAGVIGLLSALVVAAAVVLVVIRDAEKAATAQASEARRQLERAQVAEDEAKDERAKAVHASQQVTRVNDELEQKNAALVAAAEAAERARREAEEARERAEKEKRKARRDRRLALEKEQEALAAQERERAASERLRRLLEEERRRQQQQGIGHAINEVDVDR